MDEQEPAEQRSVFRLAIGAIAVALIALSVSSLNPFFAMGANNRLESSCGSKFGFEYHRDSVTPLLWSCTMYFEDGTIETRRPFP